MACTQLSISSALINKTLPLQQPSTYSSQCLTSLSTMLPPPSSATAYCRRIARNVIAMATSTSDAPAATTTTEVVPDTELPEFLKTVQEVWDKVEDKYAVTSLGVAAVIALWGSAGLVTAIDRLPLVPGVLELVGIGYTGWFAYKNLLFKPDRQALIEKIKSTYSEVISISSTE